jgi:hypothetical protein
VIFEAENKKAMVAVDTIKFAEQCLPQIVSGGHREGNGDHHFLSKFTRFPASFLLENAVRSRNRRAICHRPLAGSTWKKERKLRPIFGAILRWKTQG